MIQQEIAALEKERATVEKKLNDILIPPNEEDDRTAIMELRAGAGGQEAGTVRY